MSVVEPWALWEQEDAESKNKTPQEGDSEGNTPGRRAIHALRAKVDTVCDEDAQSHEELV